mgnify:CR=1 FL=1
MEHEHAVFLEGLQKHGKQWKTIAGMIGTRTVVQVRTHAQKYFQKMDRKNQEEPGTKRKSVAAALPSRKKTRSTKPRLASMETRSSSVLNVDVPNPIEAFVEEPPEVEL